MKLKIILLLLFLVILVDISCFCQKSIGIKPYVGLQYPLCKPIESHPKNFRANSFDEVFDFGLLVNMFPKNKLNFVTGLCFRNIGWSYSITIPDFLVKNPYSSPKKRHSEFIGLIQVPLMLMMNIYNFNLSKSENITYFSNKYIKIDNSLGFGLLYVPNNYSLNNDIELVFPGFYGDTIKYSNTFQQLRKFGLSLDLMLHFTFKDPTRNKDILGIMMYFSKGFINILDIKVDYTTNGLSNTTKVVSRGTSFGITITKPLYITFKKKSTSD